MEYHNQSPDELPPELREAVKQALHSGLRVAVTTIHGKTRYTCTDAHGQVREYNSLEELPAEARRILDQVEQWRKRR